MLQHLRFSHAGLPQLQEQPRVLSLLLDKTDERVYLINTDFELLYFNRTAAHELQAITGRKVQVGENIFAVLPASLLDTYGLLYRQSLEQHHANMMAGRSITGDGKYRTHQGEERWIKMRISPMQMPNGEVAAIAVIVKDITRRKIAERRRDEYIQHLHTILETMQEIMLAVDELQSIVSFNHAAARAFGYSGEEILGKPLSELFPEHFVELITQSSSGELQGRCAVQSVVGRRRTGEEFPIEATVSSSLHDGRFFLTLIARDVSERKQMEQKIRTANRALEQKVLDRTEALYASNQALQKLNEEKNDLINMLSHDLKNPIGIVRGFAEMLQMENNGNPEIERIAGHIAHTSETMLALVTNLLHLNTLESGAHTLHLMKLSLPTFAQALIDTNAVSAAHKGISLQIRQHAPNPVCAVIADEIALHQVIDNLLSNALKYSVQESVVEMHIFSVHEENLATIEQEVRSVGLWLTRPLTPHTVILAIQDAGPGIASAEIPLLFTKFRRLSAQPTGGESSNGLGLSIVKRLVDAMHGRVWCESVYGKGAVFYMELPRPVAMETQQVHVPSSFAHQAYSAAGQKLSVQYS
ncbi:MAG: PAS domain S-box protein [Candidatus Kapaibacterium sp.]|nr:MAG: PAS domain S-box protein [Candidatus Kapabacteria bacterium]